MLSRFAEGLEALLEAEEEDVGKYRRALRPLACWLTQDRFDRRRVNRRLRQYVQGDPAWRDDLVLELE